MSTMEFVVAYFKRTLIQKIDFRWNRKNCHNRYMRFSSAKMWNRNDLQRLHVRFFAGFRAEEKHTQGLGDTIAVPHSKSAFVVRENLFSAEGFDEKKKK